MLTKPSDRELAMTRLVDGPPSLVFDAWTKPELLTQWYFGPRGLPMVLCEIDLRVGGAYRFVWRREADGAEMSVRGVYREVTPFDRLVYTLSFDVRWFPGESIATLALARQGKKTKVTCTVLLETREARDAVLRMPVEGGVAEAFERLDELLESLGK